jgi:hypothetical protein
MRRKPAFDATKRQDTFYRKVIYFLREVGPPAGHIFTVTIMGSIATVGIPSNTS